MFDTRKFLRAHWADATQLHDWIKLYEPEPPKRPAVGKWFERQSIPSDWLATILVLLEIERGAPVSLIPYRT